MRELYQLQDPLILEISGKDAKRYLNARLTNNIKDLAVGGSCIAGMLNPQGRTEGIFTVLHRNEGEYIAYCDGGEHQRILTALKRYMKRKDKNLSRLMGYAKILKVDKILRPYLEILL